MGLLRTILALLVVGSHLGATFAVKGFFIISGFYMALVISTRYYALPVGDFYASRLLRLLPLYWIIGLLTVATELGWCRTVSNFTSLSAGGECERA